MLNRLIGLARYNRDWPKYLWNRRAPGRNNDIISFRLRNGQNVAVRRDARFTLNEIYLERVYDVPGVDLTACRTVLDLGANMGLFALYVAAKSPQATIHCFEPGSANLAVLARNIEHNAARAKIYQMAVSTYCGTGHLRLDRGSYAYALGEPSANGEDVKCVDMSEVFKLTHTERFDFVKMDIEGAECRILAECTDDQLRRMTVLSLEWHHPIEKLVRLASRLRDIGFDVESQRIDGHPFLKAKVRGR